MKELLGVAACLISIAVRAQSSLRWGLLLHGLRGDEATSLFVDHFGKFGYINGKRVEFNFNMSERMRSFAHNLR
jgi:hypothetical protein